MHKIVNLSYIVTLRLYEKVMFKRDIKSENVFMNDSVKTCLVCKKVFNDSLQTMFPLYLYLSTGFII